MTTSPPTQLILWHPSRRSVHAIAASVRGSVSSPLSLSVLMSPFWQKAHRMLQEVKKIVPEPCVPRNYDREKLQERLAKLAGGVAVIRVGGATRPTLSGPAT